jgi:murein DD-endopeptidase MepM/ murein hydrolase activator NlpD
MPGLRRGLAVAVLLAAAAVAAADVPADVLILSAYRSRVGANARPRLQPHAGVDFALPAGTPVLAAADGEVGMLIDYEPGCGVGVVLLHPGFTRWTVYCHLTRAVVKTRQAVARGERIGFSGASGNSAGVPHVHLEVCTAPCASHRDGDLRGTLDPMALVVGCHDSQRIYPTERFVLTLPFECGPWSTDASR